MCRDGGDVVALIVWSGTAQQFRVADRYVAAVARTAAPRSLSGDALTTALGFRPAYALCALGAVRDGHVPKELLAVLAR
jgi:hypothetical protein